MDTLFEIIKNYGKDTSGNYIKIKVFIIMEII